MTVGKADTPWKVLADSVGSDIVSERQSYPLNFRQLGEKDTLLNAPFANGYSTRYSEIITLLGEKQMHPIKEYFNASAARLTNEARTAAITGHPSDTGSNREDILVNWLNRHIPARFTCVLGGKVLGLKQGLSRQIDCMVVSDVAPRFELHERSICIVESLGMAISVKSMLDKAQLYDSLENLSSIPQLSEMVVGETSPIRRAGHFQKITNSLPALVVWAYQSIKADTIQNHLLQWIQANPSVPLNRLPIAIIVNEQFIIRRTTAPAMLSDGTVVPPNTWKSSYIDTYPGYGLSNLVNDLTNAVSWLNDLSLQFHPYANEALDD